MLMRTSHILISAMKIQQLSTAVVIYNKQPSPSSRLVDSHADLPPKSETSRCCQAMTQNETALLQASTSYLVHFLTWTLCCRWQHPLQPHFMSPQRQCTGKAKSLGTMLAFLISQPCIFARTKLLGCCMLCQLASAPCMVLQQSMLQIADTACMPCYLL